MVAFAAFGQRWILSPAARNLVCQVVTKQVEVFPVGEPVSVHGGAFACADRARDDLGEAVVDEARSSRRQCERIES